MKGRSIIGIPWRIKFLSCCIVDILGDDVTRPGAVDCKRSDQSQSGSRASTNTHTHKLSLSHSHTLSPIHTAAYIRIFPPRWQYKGKDCAYRTGLVPGITAEQGVQSRTESVKSPPVRAGFAMLSATVGVA